MLLNTRKNRDLIRLIEVTVGFDDLFDRVADQIGHHHDACALVNQHTDEGMAKIVDADGLEVRCLAIAMETMA